MYDLDTLNGLFGDAVTVATAASPCRRADVARVARDGRSSCAPPSSATATSASTRAG